MDTLDIENNPLHLLWAAYLVIGSGFCFRGREDHERLRHDEVRDTTDENGLKSMDLSPHFFKNLANDVGLNMKGHRLPVRQICQMDPRDPRDPYNIIFLYQSKQVRNHKSTYYLYPYTDLQLKSDPRTANDGGRALFNPLLPYGKNQLGSIVR